MSNDRLELPQGTLDLAAEPDFPTARVKAGKLDLRRGITPGTQVGR